MNNRKFLDYDSDYNIKKLYAFGLSFLDIFKLVDSINQLTPSWKFLGYINDNNSNKNNSYPYITEAELLNKLETNKDIYIVNNSNLQDTDSEKRIKNLLLNGCKLCNLIHPNIDMNRVNIGKRCIIPLGSIIGGNSKIGNFVVCHYKVLISHDVIIEDNVIIGTAATIGGGAIIKKGAIIGMGAIIMGNLTVNEGAIVGAGALVTKEVEPNTIVIGIPAKPYIKSKDE